MTPSPQALHSSGNDIVDAEFETLEPHVVSSRAAGPSAAIAAGFPAPPPTGMDMLRRSQGNCRRAAAVSGGPLFWILGLGLAVAAFWVAGGHAVMRGAAFMETHAPLRALRISDVHSRVDVSGLHPVLLVHGETANDGVATETLEPLKIVVTGNDGQITRYRLGTSGRPMRPGETFAFSSRLNVPKNGVKTVSVTFGEQDR